MAVIGRDGSSMEFDVNKIIIAINKAMRSAKGEEVENQSREIAEEIERYYQSLDRDMTIYQIENLVHDKLCEKGNTTTARSYTEYKVLKAKSRKDNTSDKAIKSLIQLTDKDQAMENSNKNPRLISTARDLMAGEISKDIMFRKILPLHMVQAHEDGLLHIHDLSNLVPPSINCCLINYKDMFDNSTVINGKMIEKPKSFQVACTVLSQLIAQIASSQHGLIDCLV